MSALEIAAIAAGVMAAAFLVGVLLGLADKVLRRAEAELYAKQPPYAWPVKEVSPPMSPHWRDRSTRIQIPERNRPPTRLHAWDNDPWLYRRFRENRES